MLRKLVAAPAVAMLIMAMAGCGSSSDSNSHSSNTPTTAAAPAGPVTQLSMTDYMFNPKDIQVKAGPNSFMVKNDGDAPHNFEIMANGRKIGGSKDLTAGQSELVNVNIPAGSYQTICTKPGHASLGMVGTLTAS